MSCTILKLIVFLVVLRNCNAFVCYHCMSINGTDPICDNGEENLMGKAFGQPSQSCISFKVKFYNYSLFGRTAYIWEKPCKRILLEFPGGLLPFCRFCHQNLCNTDKNNR